MRVLTGVASIAGSVCVEASDRDTARGVEVNCTHTHTYRQTSMINMLQTAGKESGAR